MVTYGQCSTNTINTSADIKDTGIEPHSSTPTQGSITLCVTTAK